MMRKDGPSQSYLAGFLAAIAERPSISPRLAVPAAVSPAVDAALEPSVTTEEQPVIPLDPMAILVACARENLPPGPAEIRCLETIGCFYEAPHRDAFRLRMLVPEETLRVDQLVALAAVAQEFGGGWVEWCPPSRLDLPEVPVPAAPGAWQSLADAGLKPAADLVPECARPARLLSSRLRELADHLRAQGETACAWSYLDLPL